MSEHPQHRTSAGCVASTATRGLDTPDLEPDPVAMFRRWLDDTVAAGVHEPNAMVVSHGRPPRAARRRGWCCSRASTSAASCSTPTTSPARARRSRPTRRCRCCSRGTTCSARCAWRARRRGCRPRRSEAYFASRPRESQLGAWASPQSQVVASRSALDERYGGVLARFADADDVPLPPFWGGFRVAPRGGGVLAGPQGPDARPAGLPPRDARRRGSGSTRERRPGERTAHPRLLGADSRPERDGHRL